MSIDNEQYEHVAGLIEKKLGFVSHSLFQSVVRQYGDEHGICHLYALRDVLNEMDKRGIAGWNAQMMICFVDEMIETAQFHRTEVLLQRLLDSDPNKNKEEAS